MASTPSTRRRSTSRPGMPRAQSSASQPYVTQENSLILQDGPVDEEAAELLEEFVGTHDHRVPGTSPPNADGIEEDKEKDQWQGLPWWRRPSPIWMLCLIPFSAMAQGATLAPKVELYTMLACRAIKPDIFEEGVFAHAAEAASTVSSHLPVAISKFEHMSPSSCATDPVVQAAVAELAAAVTTTMGVLSLLTTAWWGALSDRKGRVYVMSISLIGLLITDFNFINVYYFCEHLPGGYWFLLFGPVIEGALGGFSTAVAAIHAYLADTTTERTRSRIFSLNLGLLFIGMALGPTLASLLIAHTGKTISIFFAAAAVHVVYATFIWIVVPESLSKQRMKEAGFNYERQRREQVMIQHSNPFIEGVLVRGRSIFVFMSPLGVFFPDLKPNPNPLKKPQRDWNLTLLALAYGFTIALMASYNYTFQYAAAAFGWDSIKLGYFVSSVGASRAIFLTVLLPLAIKIFKPEPLVIEIPPAASETEPLLSSSSDGATSTTPLTKVLHSPTFELLVVRLSIIIEIMAYGLMGLASTGTAFALFGVMAALGVGFSPALQTVALAMYARKGEKETGRLFGALSVVQALSSQVLGPTIYGIVYMKTVAFFPRAIFFVSVIGLFISLFFSSFVRLPKDEELKREILEAHTEDPRTEGSPRFA